MREDSLGIYCATDKKFYFLESGKIYVANTVDRIKKTLIARGLIEFSPENHNVAQSYKVLTCKDARLADYTMQAIYISKNVQNTLENTEEEKPTTWGNG